MKKIIALILCCLFVFGVSYADNKSDISKINKQVAQIEKTKAGLSVLSLTLQTGELESAPPEVKYYYKPGTTDLVMLQVAVGHEIFVTKHTYYFNKNSVLKYLKETVNHPDSPPKKAIIYKKDGGVLWENIAEPAVSANKAVELFKLHMQTLKAFSKY